MLEHLNSCTCGVGSLPHISPSEACNDVLKYCPEMPYAPSLPNLTPLEDMNHIDAEYLPGVKTDGKRIYVDCSEDFYEKNEQIYLDFMEQNYERYAASRSYAAGYVEMAKRDLSGSGIKCVKCQITGPVTLGLTFTDKNRRPLAYDGYYFDLLSKMLALRAAWYESLIRSAGAPETLIIIDEPYFASLGSSVMHIDREMITAAFNDFSELLKGGIGFHCCSNTDWGFLMSVMPSMISFDAYENATEFLLYKEEISDYLKKGGVIGWGIVPSEPDKFRKETFDSLMKRYLDIREEVAAYTSYEIFDSQAVITPSCGLYLADVKEAREIMQTTADISAKVRKL